MNEIYTKGLITFKPNEKAPEFVLGSVVITPNELFAWLKRNQNLLSEYKGNKQLKLNCLKKREGGIYFVVDTYKKEVKEEVKIDLPF